MTTVQEIKPSFTLRKICHSEIFLKYKKGGYTQIRKKMKEVNRHFMTAISKNPPTIDNNLSKKDFISNSERDDTFQYVDRNNFTHSLITNNTVEYRKFLKMEMSKNDDYVPRCEYCRLVFDTENFGIPRKKEVLIDGRIIYHMSNITCSLSCSYSFLKSYTRQGSIFVEDKYESSLYLLKRMAGLENKIKPAAHYSILKANGGPLSTADYKKGLQYFMPTPNIVLVPVKEIFEC